MGVNRADREGILLADSQTNTCIRDNLPDEVAGCYEALRAFGCSSACRECDAGAGPVYRPAVCSSVCANIKASCPLVWSACDLASVYLPQCSDTVEEAGGTVCAPFIPWVGSYRPAGIPAPATPTTAPPTTAKPTVAPTPRPTFMGGGTFSPTVSPTPQPTATPPPPPTPAVSFDYAAGISVEAGQSLELSLDIIPPVSAAPMPVRIARTAAEIHPACAPDCTPAVTVDGVVRLNGGPLILTLDHRPAEGALVPLIHSTVGYSGINGVFGSFKVIVTNESTAAGELHTRIVAVTQPARNGTLFALLSTSQVGFNLGAASSGGAASLSGQDLAAAATRAAAAGSAVVIVLPDTEPGDDGIVLSVAGDLDLGDAPLSLSLGSSTKTRDSFVPATLAVNGNVTLSGPIEVSTALVPGDCRADAGLACNTTLLTVTATGEIDGTFSAVVVDGIADDGEYCTQYEGSTDAEGSSRLDVVLLQRTFGPTDCLVDRQLCKCLYGTEEEAGAISTRLATSVVAASLALAIGASF